MIMIIYFKHWRSDMRICMHALNETNERQLAAAVSNFSTLLTVLGYEGLDHSVQTASILRKDCEGCQCMRSWNPLDLKGIYALLTNSFTASGGDGFVALGQSQNLYPFGPPTDDVS